MSDGESEFFNDNKPHKLVLGESFKRNSNSAFHMMRYDFKPASVDENQAGQLEVGDTNEVIVSLPHLVGSKTPCTVYKGSKKPAQKDCVLIYDRNTGEFTLERISSQIQVKKTRPDGNSNFSSHPVLSPAPPKLPKTLLSKNQQKPPSGSKSFANRKLESSKRKNDNGNPSIHETSQINKSVELPTPIAEAPSASNITQKSEFSTDDSHSSSSSGSDSSDDGDSSEDENNSPPPPVVVSKPPVAQSQLHEDLELSESGSDSD